MTIQATNSLILGGARSGKSSYGEALTLKTGLRPIYIATCLAAHDDEMKTRIEQHQARRSDAWVLVEEPIDIARAIQSHSHVDSAILVDCLSLWLSSLLMEDKDVETATRDLLTALKRAKGPVTMVSNEVGLSVVPEHKLARRFRDAQGKLNQTLAKEVDHVVFIAAGLPLVLK